MTLLGWPLKRRWRWSLLAMAGIGIGLLSAGCARRSGAAAQAPTHYRTVRILAAEYQLPDTIAITLVADLPGFKKLQYVNAESKCTGIWLFNVVGTRSVHESYVADTIERPMAKSLESRLVPQGKIESIVPILRQDARAVRYRFMESGTSLESGYLELFDERQKLSVVTLADCAAGQLESDQQWVAQVLASQAPLKTQ